MDDVVIDAALRTGVGKFGGTTIGKIPRSNESKEVNYPRLKARASHYGSSR